MNNEEYEEIIKVLTEQKEKLEKEVDDTQKEENRLRYMASGYAALIIDTKDAELIQRAKEIADEADKLN